MEQNFTVRNELGSNKYAIFRTVDFDSNFDPHSIVLVAFNKENGEYDSLQEQKKKYQYFDKIPAHIIIPCIELRYRAESNEYVLDKYCSNTSIQACKIQTSTSGFNKK